ncbi:MAG: 2,3,4,5-tetrahydropyridine-2,6-dicarboxylate N-succinyltransferase, partial [Gammaproteobacteria bacterium]|nr:2,3,4,5-tetrahydropyridine-2,6-dicarboxylate N-succinyltransferase [Gammaproteobacteria bacterium]
MSTRKKAATAKGTAKSASGKAKKAAKKVATVAPDTGKATKKAAKKAAKKAVKKAAKVAKVAKKAPGTAVAKSAPRTAPEAGRLHAPATARPGGPDEELAFMIDSAWARRSMLTPEEVEGSTRMLVDQAIEGLESGRLRVAEPDGAGGWVVNEWLKKAVLLYFRVQEMEAGEQYPAPYWDKIPLRFADFDEAAFRKLGARVLPGAIARRGSFIGRDVVLMPSFVNIGAHIGAGTMVDTWATVGSCAQVGKHCHISGGAGIGGVLEPLQAAPTIIEDHCFIG